jgi:hypothetical protein
MTDTDRISASTAALLLGVTLPALRNIALRGELRYRVTDKGHRSYSVIDVLALRAVRARQRRPGRPSLARAIKRQLQAAKVKP